MELVATVAQSSPGPDGSYSAPVPLSEIRRYLDVAHQHRMLLVLDLQPGHASFLRQAEALRPLLLDPAVGLALDSEWKVGPGNGTFADISPASRRRGSETGLLSRPS